MKSEISIHFISNGKMYASKYVYHATQVGDELRFRDDKFYIVEKLVWVYDEPDNPAQRLNVGIAEINPYD